MDFELVFKELLQKFQRDHVRFALIGGFALHVAGFTRATHDIDFIVEADDLDKVKNVMASLGYELTHESAEFSNYWHPMGPMGCVDFLHAHRGYARQMIKRAAPHLILQTLTVPVLVPEDLIGLKIQSAVNNPDRRTLDMADIEFLLRDNWPKLDLALIREYFDLFQCGGQLDALLDRIKHAH